MKVNLPIVDYTTKNGIKVSLLPIPSSSIVSLDLQYDVGSADWTEGKTGLAHLFEHMMFQGSKNVAKNDHINIIQKLGGGANAFTSFDYTAFTEMGPAEHLETFLWLESDRLGFFLETLDEEKFLNQQQVVRNERLQRYDNQPYGLTYEKLLSNIFDKNHPYSVPVIGWMKDIESYTLEDVRGFYKKYYTPSNLSMAIAGNFDVNEAIDLIEKYFCEIPAGVKPEELKVKTQYNADAQKILKYYDNITVPNYVLTWPAPLAGTKEAEVLSFVGYVLSGKKNARLNQELVYEKQMALNIGLSSITGKYGGFSYLYTVPREGISYTDLKDEILALIENFLIAGATEDEIELEKNSNVFGMITELENTNSFPRLMNTMRSNFGTPNHFNEQFESLLAITNEDIVEVTKKYLFDDYLELHILPKNEEKDND